MKLAEDYYDLLGVDRDADERQIKRAFRSRARDLHPDHNPDNPEAEEQFRKVSEAYEVLSDQEKRAVYDRYGAEGLAGGAWQPRHQQFTDLSDIFSAFFGDDVFSSMMGGQRGGRRGAAGQAAGDSVSVPVALEFSEAALGASRTLTYEVAVPCETCDGDGADPAHGREACDRCEGQGVLRSVGQSIFGQVIQESICPRCSGQGRMIVSPCTDCAGRGLQEAERTIEVEIPGGIVDGQRIRLAGRGSAGMGGGPAGHLYLDISVADDDRFAREGDEIISVLDLTMTEAAVGVTRSVDTVDGDAVEIEIEPGTQPGEVHVLDGRGSARIGGRGRGDHRVVLNVVVPTHLSTEQEALLREFQGTETDKTYRIEGGIMSRLRRLFGN